MSFTEYSAGWIDANSEGSGEGNRCEMAIATAYVQYWFFERQKLLI
jgi:hypothetical protein